MNKFLHWVNNNLLHKATYRFKRVDHAYICRNVINGTRLYTASGGKTLYLYLKNGFDQANKSVTVCNDDNTLKIMKCK